MRRGKQRTAAAGLSLLLALGILSGCSRTESGEGEERTQKSQTQEEAVREDRDTPKLAAEEHPRFVPDGVRKLVLTEEGEEIFCLSREPEDYKMSFDYWEILNPYDETATVNTEKMYELFEILGGLNFQEPIQVAEGTDTGVRNSDTSFSIEFVNTTETEKAKKTEDADASATVLLGNSDGQGSRYAAIQGYEEEVYKISEDLIQNVFELEPFDYILKIPVLIDADTVEKIQIKGEDWEHEVWVNAAKEEYKLDKKKTDQETFSGLYQELSGILLDGELEEEIDLSGEEPELELIYQRNMAHTPEIQVAYYPYDGERDAVAVNGTCRFLVQREDVEKLIGTIEEAF